MKPLASRADFTTVRIDNALPENRIRRTSAYEWAWEIAITYKPMQTPRIGILPAKCLMASRLMPESVVG